MRLAEGGAARVFTISHRPPAHEGWLELLVHGLTFDLVGLAPATGAPPPEVAHRYGFGDGAAPAGEAIWLRPGAHLSGGENLLPVVRAAAALAAELADLPAVAGVCWHPARTMVEPGWFRRSVGDWLAGGAFPALGLAALARDADGTVRSEGLAFFTGQELRLEAPGGSDSSRSGKIAARLIHILVEDGAVLSGVDFQGPDGERLRAEPADNGRVLRVWQDG
ncbi:MAG: hypothetical protein JSS36_08455 [Proteobacteria bacterium]|nr:hypothetical protein [Pseudomonadota bacterium]